jgi:hypothetical protein
MADGDDHGRGLRHPVQPAAQHSETVQAAPGCARPRQQRLAGEPLRCTRGESLRARTLRESAVRRHQRRAQAGGTGARQPHCGLSAHGDVADLHRRRRDLSDDGSRGDDHPDALAGRGRRLQPTAGRGAGADHHAGVHLTLSGSGRGVAGAHHRGAGRHAGSPGQARRPAHRPGHGAGAHRLRECRLWLPRQGRQADGPGAAKHQPDHRTGRDRGLLGRDRFGQVVAGQPDPALL